MGGEGGAEGAGKGAGEKGAGQQSFDPPQDPQGVLDFFVYRGGPKPAPTEEFSRGEGLLTKAMYKPKAESAAWDAECERALGHLYGPLEAGELEEWRKDPVGLLAYLVLVDQVPRNIFRNTARAWAYDARAQTALRAAVADPAMMDRVREIHPGWMSLFFHVAMHAEDAEIQQLGRDLCVEHYAARPGHPDTGPDPAGPFLFWMDIHADCVKRFGRFPSRNKFLGRENTAEEDKAMAEGTCFGSPQWNFMAAKKAWEEGRAKQ